jgi:hypothetical protein
MFKRALIAAAVAAAVSAPAFADVSITGSMEMNFVVLDTNAGTTQGLDRGLQLDFNGSDKLDNGSSLIWKVSTKLSSGAPIATINARSGSNYAEQNADQNSFGSREAWVGLKGDWGSFKAGRLFSNSYLTLDWPYGQGGNWQLAENNWSSDAAPGKLTAYIFLPTSVSYNSPSFGGFSFSAQHSWDVNTSRPGAFTWDKEGADLGKKSITDLAVSFSTGSLGLNAGYLMGDGVNAANSEETQWYVGATYGFDFGLNVRALYTGYEYNSGVAGSSDKDGADWIVGGTYGFGKSYVKGSYHSFDGDGKGDAGNIYTGEYGYSLSKNTVGYARVQVRDENAGDLNQYMVGLWTGF